MFFYETLFGGLAQVPSKCFWQPGAHNLGTDHIELGIQFRTFVREWFL